MLSFQDTKTASDTQDKSASATETTEPKAETVDASGVSVSDDMADSATTSSENNNAAATTHEAEAAALAAP